MKYRLIMALSLVLFAAGIARADLSATMADLNIRAAGDMGAFRADLEARYGVGGAHLDLIFASVDSPADVVLSLWLGERSGASLQTVLHNYREHKGRGWGAVAKSLGIRPGSVAFHALKAGELDGSPKADGKRKGKERRKGKENRKGKGRT